MSMMELETSHQELIRELQNIVDEYNVTTNATLVVTWLTTEELIEKIQELISKYTPIS